MHEPTLEELKKKRYGDWSGHPTGYAYREGYCGWELYANHIGYQCRYKVKPGSLWCGVHGKRYKTVESAVDSGSEF
jgi:hypothetical protein